jgi:hypothetical protein
MGSNFMSPQVKSVEIDLTLIVPSVSTTEAGLSGAFQWGPVEKPFLIDSEEELIDMYWKPNNANANDWFTAANYLAYANKLWVVRVVDFENANNSLKATNAVAGANTSGFLVKNDDIYEENYADGELKIQHDCGDWIARYPGSLGNTLKISVCPSKEAYQSNLTGTMSVASGNNAVTGTGTAFTTELVVGDVLVINRESHKVASIANNTSLTLNTRHVTGATANTAIRQWEYFVEFDRQPDDSVQAGTLNAQDDEMHIIVIDEDGIITGQRNSVLEKYAYVSKGFDAKLPDGSTNYYKEIINQKSNWIRWSGHNGGLTNAGQPMKNTNYGAPALPINYSLQGGKDGTAITNNEKILGYNFFKSAEDLDISFILGSDADTTLAVHLINNIAENRQDCVVFLSPPRAYVVDNKGDELNDCVTFRNTLPSTSYAALDGNWKYQYDRYNDLYRWVPMNGDIAGIHVRSDEDRDPWWAAAGLNRGHVKNVIKLAWNPRQADRDILYKNGINPVVTFKGEGTVLFGQKTLLAKPSAFDRLNVRRLFIVLRKSISKMARYFLFEFNDAITRRQFVNIVEPYLRDVKGRRGITDFHVECSELNNTPEVIDRNEFIASIFVKPNRVAEGILLKFVAVRTGVDFAEVITTV